MGVTNKTAPNAITTPLNRSILLPLVKKQSLVAMNYSSIGFKIFIGYFIPLKFRFPAVLIKILSEV